MERGLDIQSKAGKENIEKIFKNGFTKNGAANIKESSINQMLFSMQEKQLTQMI